MCTLPWYEFTPYLPPGVAYIRGQLERGESTGYVHWQIDCVLKKKGSLRTMQSIFGEGGGDHGSHRYILTVSKKTEEYVWKEETCVSPNTRFELGARPLRRNDGKDWEVIRELAKAGRLDECPADVFVCHYRSLSAIRKDYMSPMEIEREVFVFWGGTGLGKSRRAWQEAGLDAFPKDPRSKFWDGYRDQEHVVIDEYRGDIAIGHLLRWLDRYPVVVETKGSGTVLVARRIWLTSNLPPESWYPGLDEATMAALMRRLKVTAFRSL